MKMLATITITYDADPDHYGTTDPAEIAKMDQDEIDNDPCPYIVDASTFEVFVRPMS